jgi:thiol-disulfide isomerase/thioredoxin
MTGARGRRSGVSRFATVLGTVVALSLIPAAGRAQDLGIEVGSAAPAAKVHTLDGKEANLSQYIGKTPVIMEFWAIWCPNCRELEPTLVSTLKKYNGKVKFVGVAVSVNESPDKVKAFVDKHSLPGDHVFDTKGEATGAYDVPATSYVVVINKAGKVVYTGLGGKQDLDAAIKKAL